MSSLSTPLSATSLSVNRHYVRPCWKSDHIAGFRCVRAACVCVCVVVRSFSASGPAPLLSITLNLRAKHTHAHADANIWSHYFRGNVAAEISNSLICNMADWCFLRPNTPLCDGFAAWRLSNCYVRRWSAAGCECNAGGCKIIFFLNWKKSTGHPLCMCLFVRVYVCVSWEGCFGNQGT